MDTHAVVRAAYDGDNSEVIRASAGYLPTKAEVRVGPSCIYRRGRGCWGIATGLRSELSSTLGRRV